MLLHQLEKPEGSTKERKRVGRGPGSGTGKTSGRGHKGQHSRSGSKTRRGFEGGQTPLHRRLPKFGFKNLFRVDYSVVNLDQLEACSELNGEETVTKVLLKEKGLVRTLNKPVKILARGELSKALTIEVDHASQAALQKIEQCGGKLLTSGK